MTDSISSTRLPLASINLESFQVTNVILNNREFIPQGTALDIKLKLDYHAVSITRPGIEEIKNFGIRFVAYISDSQGLLELNTQSTAIFASTREVDEEFLESHFARVNAPAIAYPFLRAFISTLTLNSGLAPIILPAFNFMNSLENKAVELPAPPPNELPAG
ncbi:protein-export chaperone SecB [Rufibacter glacialis]|uniref:Protein-export chaperone SecB n=1 Tax=Rufibacter glacialis TaxID=1259555 RepID=A0A5M8QMW1_9BACT|nr:protein-export chaperone SecB [Rufibacter glacialis]KAA6437475.1 hypothetical protein FOE74_02950 [Rufibacter glacialis]GGK59056.1 hypothetical protein GCM10011405_03870 [Rufibacter glacialis]